MPRNSQYGLKFTLNVTFVPGDRKNNLTVNEKKRASYVQWVYKARKPIVLVLNNIFYSTEDT